MYVYENHRSYTFTEEGQKMFLSIRDNAQKLCRLAGCATMEMIIRGQVGSSWDMLACVDRLKELGELIEVYQINGVPGQYRIFHLQNW